MAVYMQSWPSDCGHDSCGAIYTYQVYVYDGKDEEPLDDILEKFDEVRRVVGYEDYNETAAQYDTR